MTNTKHTPGPWRIGGGWAGHPASIIAGEGDEARHLAERVSSVDAQLMAAAPELLAALEHLRMTVENLPNTTVARRDIGAALLVANTAIARAKGEKS